jgi:RNA polymerase sigma-70 factor (ECF subfamily)
VRPLGEKESATGPAAVPNFEEVYRAHFRLVWRLLARLGVRDADRLDVAQNVFIIVYRQLAGFEGRSKLTTWLGAICRLVAMDYLRSAAVRHEVVPDARDIAQRQGAVERMVYRLDSMDLFLRLESVLRTIPDKFRVVFVMFELNELSGREIARLLNVPVGTVRSRLRLARRLVKRNLKLLELDRGSSLIPVLLPAAMAT